MLITPGFRSNNINDIKEFSELDRKIIIYATQIGLDPNIKCKISISNTSIQNGSIGGIQDRSELLYTLNFYYGTIESPIFYLPNGKLDINREAEVRIIDHAFTCKMIDKFKDIEYTSNYLNMIFMGSCLNYKNSNKIINDTEIVPCDPRFYNLDHQFLITGDDSGYYTDAGLELGMDMIAKNYGGVGYKLHELFDEHTHVYVSRVNIDDPFKILKTNTDLYDFINKSICNIQNYGLLALLSSYTIILDRELGYNVFNLRRSFKKMNKEYERFELANFYEIIKEIYENLLDSNYNIRMTIIYGESQTNISILPLNKNENKTNEIISDIKMYETMTETYNSF